MKLSKPFYILSIAINILILPSMSYADTCYNPNSDRYYNCSGDEFIAPVAAGILFGAVIATENNNNGYYHNGHYNNHYNNNYNNHYNNHYGNHGHYNNSYHGTHHGH